MASFCTNCGRDLGDASRFWGSCCSETTAAASATEAAWSTAGHGERWSFVDPARHAVPLDGGTRHRPAFDRRGLGLLGAWTEGVVWITVVLQVPGLWFAIRQQTLLDRYRDDELLSPAFELEDAENAWIALNLVTVLVILATTVLLIVWTYRLYGQATSLGATDFRLRRGFTIGAWFIPLANVVMVPMMLADLEKAFRSTRIPLAVYVRRVRRDADRVAAISTEPRTHPSSV